MTDRANRATEQFVRSGLRGAPRYAAGLYSLTRSHGPRSSIGLRSADSNSCGAGEQVDNVCRAENVRVQLLAGRPFRCLPSYSRFPI